MPNLNSISGCLIIDQQKPTDRPLSDDSENIHSNLLDNFATNRRIKDEVFIHDTAAAAAGGTIAVSGGIIEGGFISGNRSFD